MIIRKSYKYRLNPTKKQASILQKTLDECRWLYNYLLEQRKLSYEELGLFLSKFEQNMFLPEPKEERPSLLFVHSQVLQNVTDRIDKAFKNFFRRCKSGEKPGFSPFRGIDRYNSFCYSQTGFSIEGYVYLSCELEAIPLAKSKNSIGIDLGIESFATLSDGQKIENPRFFKKAETNLAKA